MYVQFHVSEVGRLKHYEWYKEETYWSDDFVFIPVNRIVQVANDDNVEFLRGVMTVLHKQIINYKTHAERKAFISKYENSVPFMYITYEEFGDKIVAYDLEDNVILKL